MRMDKTEMRALLAQMETAVEGVLQQDAAFFEALHALKFEIDEDARVKSAVHELRAAGQRVFSSFVPRIKVRVRTEEGIFTLARPSEAPSHDAVELVAKLAQELKDAASAVILGSNYCRELERIVNEAATGSDTFEQLASRIERAGYQVLISIDLSAYAQVQASSAPAAPVHRSNRRISANNERVNTRWSADDVNFLKQMKIKVDENLSC